VLTELNAEGQLGAIAQLDEAKAIEASSSIQGAYEICKKPTQVIYNKEKGPN
jgi:hypothetical protein